MSQCRFLFSSVFCFRKVTQEIFLELDNSKTEVPIFTVPKQLTWRESKRGSRAATRGLGADSTVPVTRLCVGHPVHLRICLFAHILTLDTRVIFHEKFRAAVNHKPISEGF